MSVLTQGSGMSIQCLGRTGPAPSKNGCRTRSAACRGHARRGLGLDHGAGADARLAPPTYRVAMAAAIANDNTKRTTIQTKLSTMTIGFRSTSQFGSHAATINNGITPAVGCNVANASA